MAGRAAKQGVQERAPRGPKYVAKREHILVTALDLFREKGYDATSLQEVADAAGLLKGSLYYYFKSKDHLLVEVAARVHWNFSESMSELEGLRGSALERIHRHLHQTAYNSGRNQKLLQIFYREFQRFNESDRARIVELRDEQEGFLRMLIGEGQSDGTIRTDVDVKVAAIGLETMATNVYAWYDPRQALSLDEIANSLADLGMHSLRS